MNPRDEHSDNILPYLNNELVGKTLEDFLAHLRTCIDCRTLLKEERTLSEILHRSRPLYSAPAELHARVSASLAQDQRSMSNRATSRFHELVTKSLWQPFRSVAQLAPRWTVLVPAVLVVAICLILIPNGVREVRAASYIDTAVSTHRSYLAGNLPLEVRSSSPEAVTTWLADKVSFPFRLPASQVDRIGKPYQLVGARIVNFKGSNAALVTYEGNNKDTISLLVASNDSAVVAGGDEVRAGNLIFHYRTDSGLKVITWTTHGLAYALVSNVAGSAQGSCLVCHQNMADHDTFPSKP